MLVSQTMILSRSSSHCNQFFYSFELSIMTLHDKGQRMLISQTLDTIVIVMLTAQGIIDQEIGVDELPLLLLFL